MAGSATQTRRQQQLQQQQHHQHQHSQHHYQQPPQQQPQQQNSDTTNVTATTTFMPTTRPHQQQHHQLQQLQHRRVTAIQGSSPYQDAISIGDVLHTDMLRQTTADGNGGRGVVAAVTIAAGDGHQQQQPAHASTNRVPYAYPMAYQQSYQYHPQPPSSQPPPPQSQQHVVNITMDDERMTSPPTSRNTSSRPSRGINGNGNGCSTQYNFNLPNNAASELNASSYTATTTANTASPIAVTTTKHDVLEVAVLDELYAQQQLQQQHPHRRKTSGGGGVGGGGYAPDSIISTVDNNSAGADADALATLSCHDGMLDVDGADLDATDGSGGGGDTKRVRHRHRRPLYRRLISYMRNAWTAGVNFSSSNGMV